MLIRAPDGHHLLIDGGCTRAKQPTGKSAADFVDGKIFKDYGLARIRLDAIIASHCNADHYGGLWDVLRTDEDVNVRTDGDAIMCATLNQAKRGWNVQSFRARF